MSVAPVNRETVEAVDLGTRIRAEQIRIVYNNMPLALLNNSLVPLLLLAALWYEASRPWLLGWVAVMLMLGILRFMAMIAFRRASPSPCMIERWRAYLIIGAFISGSLWGLAAVVLTDPDVPMQYSMILLIIAGSGAASAISYSAYLPSFYTYFLPSLLPFAAAVFFRHDYVQLMMSLASILFVGALSFFAFNLNRALTESLRLRYENTALVEELQLQKKELLFQKESAERANTAKTRFLAAASHDLRQPLHAMGLFISALSERVRGAVTRKLVLQLSASTEALRGLLNALLDISRLDAGVIHPHMGSASVQELLDRMAHDNAAYAAEKNISLKCAPTKYWVRCDVTLLERILRNLVANAICYTERGGVLVACRRRGEQVRIEVWDTGIGIAADELNNIFHEFYQVGNPERDRSKGLGLGLAIARRLAHLLDIRIEVKSVPGKGSVFALTLPRSEAVDDIQLAAPVVPGYLNAALVVVIDDERAIREATQVMLEGWGCEAVLADSGDNALAAVAQTSRAPAAIIADYRLRNSKTGTEAIEDLRNVYGRDIPAIIITGDTAPDRLREAEASGYYLLHKPLAPAKLRALLSHVLTTREAAVVNV